VLNGRVIHVFSVVSCSSYLQWTIVNGVHNITIEWYTGHLCSYSCSFCVAHPINYQYFVLFVSIRLLASYSWLSVFARWVLFSSNFTSTVHFRRHLTRPIYHSVDNAIPLIQMIITKSSNICWNVCYRLHLTLYAKMVNFLGYSAFYAVPLALF
jgi:DNA repair photolyase